MSSRRRRDETAPTAGTIEGLTANERTGEHNAGFPYPDRFYYPPPNRIEAKDNLNGLIGHIMSPLHQRLCRSV